MRSIECSWLIKTVQLFGFSLLLHLNAQAINRDSIAKIKADFIINIAQGVRYSGTNNPEHYTIGVYGRGRDFTLLVKELKKRNRQHILGKKLKVLLLDIHHFKRIDQVKPVDLLYINGDTRVRLSRITSKMEGNPYIILTENFPFGTSALNFVVNDYDEIQFEINPEPLKRNGIKVDAALLSSKSRVTSSVAWNEKLQHAMRMIDNQQQTIDGQEEELSIQSNVIKYQRIILAIALLSIFLVTGLGTLLYRSDRQKIRVLDQMMDSINYAQRIQNALLPRSQLIKGYFKESFIFFQPKDVVSGDFYWVEEEQGRIFFSVADCTGHGVPGALMSVICSTSLTKCVKELKISDPSKILEKTVEILEDHFAKGQNDVSDGMDLALCSFNSERNKLSYAGANNSLYYIRDGVLNRMRATRRSVGQHTSQTPFQVHHLDVLEGDCFYLFSDGFVDQFGGAKGKKFKYAAFRRLLLEHHQKPMEVQQRMLKQAFLDWKGELEQVDDVCVMGIRV